MTAQLFDDPAPTVATGHATLPGTVAGIDLSLTSTGIALISPTGWVTRTVRSKGRKGQPVIDTARRIAGITRDVLAAVDGCCLAVVEAPSYASTTGAQHERGGLWWRVVCQLIAAGVPVATVPPQTRARYATGRGNAGKDEVLAAVVRRYPDVPVTGNDVADAVCLASLGARWLGHPAETLPAVNIAAVDKCAWPTGVTR